MRAKGESVNEIARKLGVSKGTASLWVRDIILSVKQLEKLRQKSIKGAELGRMRGALKQKQKRLNLVKRYKRQGIRELRNLSDSEFYIAGLALYWAEGSKKTPAIQFCNSDPKLINFMINWLKKNFDIGPERLAVKVGINEAHRPREKVVKDYWSKITGIPLAQFRKTSFKKTKNKKVYTNFENHCGTLDVRVLKPGELYYKIMGLIEGLSKAG